MYSTDVDEVITRDQLVMIPTPEGRGRFHQPYPFGEYVDDVALALDHSGIEILGEEYAVTKDHQRMFGVMEIGAKPLEGELITADEWKLLVGLRGSHDQKVQRGLVLGSSVMVCSNLCFGGNIGKLNTKQTTNIGMRLPGLIRDAVSRIPALAQRQERVYDAYHNTELRARGGDAALVEIYRRNGLSSAQLGRAINEWHEPTHEEHASTGWSAWRLMNSVTESLKPTGNNVNMETVAHRTQVTTKFLDEVCHIDF
jgi:hypothetical protein